MKTWGLGNSNHVSNKSFTQFLAFLVFACCFFSVGNNLSPIHPARLTELLHATLAPNTPGLTLLVTKLNEQGFAFEAEAALALAAQGERVLGFDLDINFKEGFADICIDGEITTLNSTEFDIIANHAVECKSGPTPFLTDQDISPYDHYTHKDLKQAHGRIFHLLENPNLDPRQQAALLYQLQPILAQCIIKQSRKEKMMLTWCKELSKEIGTGQIGFSFLYSRTNRPYVVINGPSTCWQNVAITSTWFTTKDRITCTQELVEIIYLLATKESLLFFNQHVTPVFAQLLTDAHVTFEANVHLPLTEDELTQQIAGMHLAPPAPSTI